jgi:hypothetical protein
VTGQEHWRTDKGFTETYDGTAWRVYRAVNVAALADITNPFAGQVVWRGTVSWSWTGSAWVPVQSIGPTAKWYASGTGQSVPSGSNVKLAFATAQQTNTAVVTASSPTIDTFTAVLAGTYEVDVGARHDNTGAAMELHVYSPGNVAFAVANTQLLAGSGNRSVGVSGSMVLAAGDTFAVNAWNNGTGGAIDTAWGKSTHIGVRFVGP